jgi:hypothetical protein
MKTVDARTPVWAWTIVLIPLGLLLFISVTVYVLGYKRAKSLSESLVPIDAVIMSVKEEACGGRTRHACYRIELIGSPDGIDHRYQTYVRGWDGKLSVIAPQRVQTILVPPHPRGAGISKMYWSKDGPIEDFRISSTMLLIFIPFEIGMVPVGFWLSARKETELSKRKLQTTPTGLQ